MHSSWAGSIQYLMYSRTAVDAALEMTESDTSVFASPADVSVLLL